MITNRISGNIEILNGSKADINTMKTSIDNAAKTVRVDIENVEEIETGRGDEFQTDEPTLSPAKSKIAGISSGFDRSPKGVAEGEGDIENAQINISKPL